MHSAARRHRGKLTLISADRRFNSQKSSES
ncbi:hypothetical protein BVI434_790034 [Burkholderia vietnamiensis]|nr:hypothetical protein BVI434_790034 [Burkholderia vietnamiensis]